MTSPQTKYSFGRACPGISRRSGVDPDRVAVDDVGPRQRRAVAAPRERVGRRDPEAREIVVVGSGGDVLVEREVGARPVGRDRHRDQVRVAAEAAGPGGGRGLEIDVRVAEAYGGGAEGRDGAAHHLVARRAEAARPRRAPSRRCPRRSRPTEAWCWRPCRPGRSPTSNRCCSRHSRGAGRKCS